jgi:hypothetical protein
MLSKSFVTKLILTCEGGDHFQLQLFSYMLVIIKFDSKDLQDLYFTH